MTGPRSSTTSSSSGAGCLELGADGGQVAVSGGAYVGGKAEVSGTFSVPGLSDVTARPEELVEGVMKVLGLDHTYSLSTPDNGGRPLCSVSPDRPSLGTPWAPLPRSIRLLRSM